MRIAQKYGNRREVGQGGAGDRDQKDRTKNRNVRSPSRGLRKQKQQRWEEFAASFTNVEGDVKSIFH